MNYAAQLQKMNQFKAAIQAAYDANKFELGQEIHKAYCQWHRDNGRPVRD